MAVVDLLETYVNRNEFKMVNDAPSVGFTFSYGLWLQPEEHQIRFKVRELQKIKRRKSLLL